MSIWCECEGTVVMKQGSGFSIRKAWEGIYDELSYSEVVVHEKDTVRTSFRAALSLEGVDAAKCVEQFVQLVTRDRMYCWSQITANIRFYIRREHNGCVLWNAKRHCVYSKHDD